MNNLPTDKFQTIYADPPWPEKGGGKIKRGADRHYPVMKTKDIMELPVGELADNNCHLYLWVTNNYLKAGLDTMSAWGFRYVTMITWYKDGNVGLGQYYRGRTEHCLFGVRGSLPYKLLSGKRQQGETGFVASRGTHSEKPEEMRIMIERVSYGPRIELFARKKVSDWTVWGNEIEPM